ncbi:PREDICTED: APC membrane recruitment protein 3 [Chrysochloris asiatica]|uniref:APC membrane recruitment protein 3 n=1 Tax=Chrysochloris asiatica TaxID=185453 RepID=A0A9B0X0K2_CHRAS|nr:PREDICTED: APC membrane recruitment protein 3 [Chrysochloris asiatica]
MELKRGKTFIKSSLQFSHEKPQVLEAACQSREDSGLCSVSLEGQQKSCGDRGPLASPILKEYCRFPNNGAQSGAKEGHKDLYGATFKLVRKSKTHDCMLEAVTATSAGTLVSSASYPGPPSSWAPAVSCGSQHMIDYRHFVPQMPFVPAVAKSIPRKRISLKCPKKSFWNLFHFRRNRTENLTSLAAKGKALSFSGGQLEATGKLGTTFFHLGEGPAPDSLCQDLPDGELPSDSSFDLCRALCEDVTSLKSFDSLTGCGEIFADESSVSCLEPNESSESTVQEPQSIESKFPRAPSQSNMEQLASPAQNEVSDIAKCWDSVNHSVKQQQQHTLLGPWLGTPQEPKVEQPRLDTAKLAKLSLCSCKNPHSGSKANSIDTGTPKSEQPESVSTSDEGYYDSSPGLEDDKEGKEALSPGTPAATFPQDTYSGDALYELFCDPNEGPIGLSLKDDLCVSESLAEPVPGTPLSICSFHMEAKENLAPLPDPNLLDHDFLQSSWKGKECLLKFCDTELSITMGIINWLRRGPELQTPHVPAPGDSSSPPDPWRAPRGLAEKLEVSSMEACPCPEILEDKGDLPSNVSRATMYSTPLRQGLWMQSGTKGQPIKESKVQGVSKWSTHSSSKSPPLELIQVSKEDLFSSVKSVAKVATDTSKMSKISNPPAFTGSQKEPRPPMNLGCLQGPWKLNLGSTLEQDPSVMGCVAQVAALQVYQNSHCRAEIHQRQDVGSGLCGLPISRSSATLQQRDLGYLPAATCSLPCSSSLLQSPQDQRYTDHNLGLRWPSGAQRSLLDSVPSRESFSPGTLGLAFHSQSEAATFTSPTDQTTAATTWPMSTSSMANQR